MSKNIISMNVSVIGTDDGKSTLEVRRTWNEKGKKVIAIGIYPTISEENWGMLDEFNMHLLNHANDLGWGELRMLDLYVPVPKRKKNINQLQKDNSAYIEEILEEKDINTYDVIIAWESSMRINQEMIKAKIKLLSMLLEKGINAKCIAIDGLNVKKNYGVHPVYLAIYYPKDKWKLVDFPVKEMLEELEKRLKPDNTIKKKKMKRVVNEEGE